MSEFIVPGYVPMATMQEFYLQWDGRCDTLWLDLMTFVKARPLDYDDLATERDELIQARNGLIENNDNLHIQLAELRDQLDEGFARQAELREELRQMTVARDRWQFDYKNEQDTTGRLIDRCDHLTKRLAEAEKQPRALTDVIEIARKIDKEAFAKGTQNVEVGTFRSLAYAPGRLTSPACTNEQK